MAGKPAAHVGSATQHVPIVGIAAHNVLIHGRPAWTSELPSFCGTHGLEAVGMGSETVLINNQRAARVGDFLQGAGPPNRIMVGADDVLIGTPGIGTATPEAQVEFCAAYCALVHDWPQLTPEQRQQRYKTILAQMFAKFGAPGPDVADISEPPADASWDSKAWQINVGKGAWMNPNGPPTGHATLHEIRHGEQTFMAMRAIGGPGVTKVPRDVCKAAERQPLDPDSPEARYGRLHADNELRQPGLDNRSKIIRGIHDAAGTPGYDAAVQAYREQPGGADAQTVEEPGKCGGCR